MTGLTTWISSGSQWVPSTQALSALVVFLNLVTWNVSSTQGGISTLAGFEFESRHSIPCCPSFLWSPVFSLVFNNESNLSFPTSTKSQVETSTY